MNSSNALRLFRVYSSYRANLVVRVWAHDNTEAVLNARESYPALARLDGVKAYPA